MKKIKVVTGFLPEDTLTYKGEYIYKVLSVREGVAGLGPGYPQAEWLDLELEGHGGINHRMEREISMAHVLQLDGRGHKYY